MKKVSFKILQGFANNETPILLGAYDICDDKALDETVARIKGQAYNGEYTVEDIPDPPHEPTELERLRADVDYIAMEKGVTL